MIGDTINLHAPRTEQSVQGGQRLVEIVQNGQVVAKQAVPADGNVHALQFDVNVARSGWIALRHFPELHTNPVNVIVNGAPIRASRASARWCAETIKLLWHNRRQRIAVSERAEAQRTYQKALRAYARIAAESPDDQPK